MGSRIVTEAQSILKMLNYLKNPLVLDFSFLANLHCILQTTTGCLNKAPATPLKFKLLLLLLLLLQLKEEGWRDEEAGVAG